MSRNRADDEVQGEGERSVPLKAPETRGSQCQLGTSSVFICLVLTGQKAAKKEKQETTGDWRGL